MPVIDIILASEGDEKSEYSEENLTERSCPIAVPSFVQSTWATISEHAERSVGSACKPERLARVHRIAFFLCASM